MGALEIRRIKFVKTQKKKVAKFFFELRLYLMAAFYKFEVEFSQGKNKLTTDEWMQFNRNFRKIYRTPKEIP